MTRCRRILLFLLFHLSPGLQAEQPVLWLPQLQGAWTTTTPPAITKDLRPNPVHEGFYVQTGPSSRKGLSGLFHCPEGKPLNLTQERIQWSALHGLAHYPVEQLQLRGSAQKGWTLLGRDPKTKTWRQASLRWLPRAPMPKIQRGSGPLRVALYDDYGSFGKGVPRCRELLSHRADLKIESLSAEAVAQGRLREFHLVIFTGGSGGKQASTLGLAGRLEVRDFVQQGGGYLGICAGNYLACSGFSWGLGILDAKTKSSRWARGVGDLQIEAVGAGRSVLGLPAGLTQIRYANGPVFAPAGEPNVPDFETLALFRTEFAGNGSPPGAQIHSPAIVCGRFGQGRVLCSSPHPEQQAGMEGFVERAVRWLAPEQDPAEKKPKLQKELTPAGQSR